MTQLSTQQAMLLAVQHHQAGRLAEAENIYRQVLMQVPDYADAPNLLGMIALQVGQLDAAIDLIRKAIALNPAVADFHNNLGNALIKKQQFDEAIPSIRQAISLNPAVAEFHNSLGNALSNKEQIDEAIAAYRKALELNSNYAEAHNNLGSALSKKGLFDEAMTSYRRALSIRPDYAKAQRNLGKVLHDKGDLAQAIAAYRQILAIRPDDFEAHNSLGLTLSDKGEFDEAIVAYGKALQFKPDFADAYNNLGIALSKRKRFDEAIAAFGQALELKPGSSEIRNNLGNTLQEKGMIDEAHDVFLEALRLDPGNARIYGNLGRILRDQGLFDESIAAYRRALALKFDSVNIHSNLVFTQLFHEPLDAQRVLAESREWARQYADPLKQFIQPHTNDHSPDRRLRVGFVSGDFRDHVVARNLLPLFQEYDRRQFEFFCYYNANPTDNLTEAFQALAGGWRDICNMSDEAVARMIREDRIDILVDLSLHSAMHSLLVFARKPAPVQVTFAGYPGTTGLETIDYRLTDPYLDPPGEGDEFYSEQSIRLPNTFWCYDAKSMDVADGYPVTALPALRNGYITFGCLNKFMKVGLGTIDLWSKILATVNNSRLILLTPRGRTRERLLNQFTPLGIDPERIRFLDRLERKDYLRMYEQIDIGLDTLPYNGHTTSLDALWMGVPVVTRIGHTVVGRAGFSVLTNLGLPELVAHTPDQYVQIAVDLAGDLPLLTELRSSLRERMKRSPVMDVPAFTRSIESAFREMWRSWCLNTV